MSERDYVARLEQELDEIQTATMGPDVEDALAYVEMRNELLGPHDPLVVLADVVREVSRHFNSNAVRK